MVCGREAFALVEFGRFSSTDHYVCLETVMPKVISSLCLLLALGSVGYAKDKPLVIDKLAESHDNTSADAILTVEKHMTDDGPVLHFNIHLFTEYLSRKGTGRAYAALVIFDQNGQQLDTIEASNTIGAVWGQKRSSKSTDSSITEAADLVGGWVFVIDAEHNHGIPITPLEVKNWWKSHRDEYLRIEKELKPGSEATVREFGIVYKFK